MADALADEVEVNVSTFRRWVHDLRVERENVSSNGSAPVEAVTAGLDEGGDQWLERAD